MPLLETRQLTLHAGTKRLCQQLDWYCNRGEIWAVLGRNGAGKTRLLHTLAGLPHARQIRCDGTILLHNKQLTDLPRKQIARQLGLLLQDYHDPFPGSVIEYVLMGRHPHLHAWQWESDDDYARASTALHLVGLENFAQRDIQTLSGGEFQRMRIAMLLVQDPQVLLLDEPINHLDLQYQHAILSALTTKITDSERVIIMTLHDVNLAQRYCSHALLLTDDGCVQHGPCSEILTEKSLSELYHYTIKRISQDGRDYFFPE